MSPDLCSSWRAVMARGGRVALLAGLVACEPSGLRGEYTSRGNPMFDNHVSYDFVSNSMVTITTMGVTQEMPYALEDGRLLLGPPGAARVVLALDADGCFGLPGGELLGVRLCKAESPDGGASAGSEAASRGSTEVSGTRSDGSKLSSNDKAAVEFIRNNLEEHWVQSADGWTTQFNQNVGAWVQDIPPLYKQYRHLRFTISPATLTESMRLNGTDYRAQAVFEASPERVYRTEADYANPRGWSNWSQGYLASVAVERRNGKWLMSDASYFRGTRPTGPVPATAAPDSDPGDAGVASKARRDVAPDMDPGYLDAMRRDLRNLSTVQFAYFAANARFATREQLDQGRLYGTSTGVSVRVLTATEVAWSADASHAATSTTCRIQVSMSSVTSDQPLCSP